jgi:hypothetical protein
MSWYQLSSIAAEAAAWKLRERTEPPLACPYDGEPLRDTPRSQPGGLYCPLGNYRWPQQQRIF